MLISVVTLFGRADRFTSWRLQRPPFKPTALDLL